MFEISGIGIAAAFAAGAISFLSPCVLPLVPGYVSYVAGRELDELRTQRIARAQALGMSLVFILGFSTVFVLLGAGAQFLGHTLLEYRAQTNLIGGAIIVVFGLSMLGLLRIPMLQRDVRLQLNVPGGRVLSAYLLGIAFAFGWTPCIGPVLGSILMVGASGASGNAAALLAVYSLGLAVPFLLVALFIDRFVQRMRSVGRTGMRLYKAAGVVLVIMGVLILTNRLSWIAQWLAQMFPALSRIG